MALWFFMCLSDMGHVRVSTLRNHLKQNNDFLQFWYRETHLPERQRLKVIKRSLRLILYFLVIGNISSHICNKGVRELDQRSLRRNTCREACEWAHFPSQSCRDLQDTIINHEGNEYYKVYNYEYRTDAEDARLVKYQQCMYYAVFPEEEGRITMGYVEDNRRENTDVCFTSCVRSAEAGGDPRNSRPNMASCPKAQSQAEYDAQFDHVIGNVTGKDGTWYKCVVPADPNSAENKCDIFYKAGMICVSEKTAYDDILYAAQFCFSERFEDKWCISLHQVLLVVGISNAVNFILSSILILAGDTTDETFKDITRRFVLEALITLMYASVCVSMISQVTLAYRLNKLDTIAATASMAIVADQLKSFFVVQPTIWWLIIRRCGRVNPGIQEYNEEYIMQWDPQDSLLTEMRCVLIDFLEWPPISIFMTHVLVGTYTLFVLLQLAFFDTLISKYETVVAVCRYVDLTYNIFFIFEVCAKTFAYADLYLRNPWNVFDIAVIAGSMTLWVKFTSVEGGSKGLGLMRLVRLLQMMMSVGRVSAGRKKLATMKKTPTEYEVGSEVDKVLELVDELQGQNNVAQYLKQDLEWFTEIIVENKLYKISVNENNNSSSSQLNAWIKEGAQDGLQRTKSFSSIASKIGVSSVRRSTGGASHVRGTTVKGSNRTKGSAEESAQLRLQLYSRSNLSAGEEGQIESSLLRINEWTLDVFHVVEVLDVNLIPIMFLKLAIVYDFVPKLTVDFDLLFNYTTNIQERSLNTVPFHSPAHTSGMLQACHFFCLQGLTVHLNALDRFTLLFACLVANDGHPGLTNNFLVAARHPSALRYNDTAVLQNYNLSSAFALLMNPECNFLAHVTKETQDKFRKMLISIILKLDFQKHFDELSIFKTKLASDFPLPDSEEDATALLAIALRMADMSWTCRPLHQYLQWSEKFMGELFLQGDLERQMGLPVSPLCERDILNTSKAQLAYLLVIVQPLAISFTFFINNPLVQKQVIEEGLDANRVYLRSWIG